MTPTLCQSCGENPATIHITEIKKDTKRELHICEACANSKGIGSGAAIPAMLAGLVQGARRQEVDLTCPRCGITFEEFRTKARFGCPHDYEAFAEALGPLFDRIHGSRRHTGRLPRGRTDVDPAVPDRLLRLRRRLQQAVKAERYEEAARIRDEIRDLEARTAADDAAGPAVGEGQARGSP